MHCIDDCVEFDIPTMVIHLPDNQFPVNELGVKRINKLVDRAEKFRINIAMENLRNYKNLKYMMETINSKNLGFCYDCCHNINYNSDKDLLDKYGNRLMAIHLHDNGGMRK